MEKIKVILVTGPTATGKSGIAFEIASVFNGEIIGADSMQVYKYMDIGTAKPSKAMLKRIPHHLIDIIEPDEEYEAARFRRDAVLKIRDINGRGKNVIIAGGTGLYIKALTGGLFEGPKGDRDLREGLRREAEKMGGNCLHERLRDVDPRSAAAIHPNNFTRIIRALEVFELTGRPISDFHIEHGFSESPFDTLKIGLIKDRAILYGDIAKRVDGMIEDGLIDETKRLLEMGYDEKLKPMRALGYRETISYLKGELKLEDSIALLKRNTRHYAKRQITWFRRDGEIRWFSPEQKNDIMNFVERHIN